MIARALAVALLIGGVWPSIAQNHPGGTMFADATAAIGPTEGSLAFSVNYDWHIGKREKFIIGLGGRFTSYLGKNRYYVTAPAELTSGGTGPFVIFKENIPENMDTLLIQTAQVNALNLLVTLGYVLSDRWMIRFNIDVIGLSFGKARTGNYINGSQGSFEASSPTIFNLLLVSDNDRGSLNSEFSGRYIVNDKWGIKGGLQFLFTEYTTDDEVQQFPAPNDRFRKKSLMFSAGVTYTIKQ